MGNGYLKVFVDWGERYQKLSDAEFGRLMRAAIAYKAGGPVPELNGREELMWDGVKLDIDRDNEKYSATCEARSEAGKRGAERRWNGKNSKCHLPYGKNGQDKEEDKKEDKDRKETLPNGSAKKKFVPPTVEEVKAYCDERQNSIDPVAFVNFYASKGWLVGKSPMKNWKAAVVTWEQKQKHEKAAAPTGKALVDHFAAAKSFFGVEDGGFIDI